jgi:FkbM family methyltransferase
MRRTSWDEGVVHCVLIQQDYTPPGFTIEPGDTVIDIGGNIGCFAVLAATLARHGRVVVFEPERENYQLLCRNVRANHLSNVEAVHAAVAARSGAVTLYKAQHGPLHTTIPHRLGDAAGLDVVTATTLADIFDRYQIATCNFLKLDCEGAEYEILYNTPADYLRRVEKIALEYHAHIDKQRTAGKLVAYLETQGFQTVEFTDFVGYDAGFIKARRSGP